MRSSGCPGKEREERMCERAETKKRNGRNMQDLDQERRNRVRGRKEGLRGKIAMKTSEKAKLKR